MRTTVRLHDPLLAEAKKYAAETGKTLTAVIEDALRETLARRKHTIKRRPLRLPTFPGGKLQPGVDLDDSSALLDLMEGRDAPH
ncbi:MAG: type II toxin-antitoxin system VapB family antitoxin [Acidobacteriia bacterium]|nr:type II toxin-antitoxin system VapB family antitoxin [Terriglobia bacterium]